MQREARAAFLLLKERLEVPLHAWRHAFTASYCSSNEFSGVSTQEFVRVCPVIGHVSRGTFAFWVYYHTAVGFVPTAIGPDTIDLSKHHVHYLALGR